MLEAEKAEKECEAKEQQQKEKPARRAAKDAETQAQRAARDPNKPFSGILTSKNKADLEDIVIALGLPGLTNGKKLTKKDLINSINAHFDANVDQRTNPRFIGLFTCTRGRKRSAPSPDENEPPTDQPPTTRRRVDAIPIDPRLLPPPLPTIPFYNQTNLSTNPTT